MWFETGMRTPTREQWPRLKAALRMGNNFDLCFEEAEREITGEVQEWTDRSNYAITSKDGFRRDKPASDLARQWEGWGTALKPASEPIVLARKPLEGTVAANVLKWGVGALNIDGCRIEFEDTANPATNPLYRKENGYKLHTGDDSNSTSWKVKKDRGEQPAHSLGRWPANVILSYPENQYRLRRDVTEEQKRELYRWLSENP